MECDPKPKSLHAGVSSTRGPTKLWFPVGFNRVPSKRQLQIWEVPQLSCPKDLEIKGQPSGAMTKDPKGSIRLGMSRTGTWKSLHGLTPSGPEPGRAAAVQQKAPRHRSFRLEGLANRHRQLLRHATTPPPTAWREVNQPRAAHKTRVN